MAWETLYPVLAEKIDQIPSDPPNALTYSREAIDIVLDVISADDGGTLIATSVLPIVYRLYLEVYRTWAHTLHVKRAVEKINDFTIRYYGDLTTFINNVIWTNGCVPHYWAEYSEDAGFDISGWVVCS